MPAQAVRMSTNSATAGTSRMAAFGPWTGAAGTVDSISIVAYKGSGTISSTFGLYSDSSGPNTKVVDTGATNLPDASATPKVFTTLAADSAAAITAVSYWIVGHSAGQWYSYHDAGSLAQKYTANTEAYTAGTLTTPFPSVAGTLSSRNPSAFVTYTAAASGIAPVWMLFDRVKHATRGFASNYRRKS
jgi:hypothetical protein